ncbi:MAG: hypothetical protein DRO39_09245 [Thermoprotei archaeon]|nr:MAG: hypothetical protein DRO39_09245 [Thermoprotei archaeon]
MPAPGQRTKELKTFSAKVVTPEHIKRDPRKMKLLHIIAHVKAISEKGLTHLLYLLKTEKGIDLGYNFVVIGNKPMSKQVLDELMMLLYAGLIEHNPRNKKLQLTSQGAEFLEQNRLPDDEIRDILSAVDELKPKIEPIEMEVELAAGGRRGRRF